MIEKLIWIGAGLSILAIVLFFFISIIESKIEKEIIEAFNEGKTLICKNGNSNIYIDNISISNGYVLFEKDGDFKNKEKFFQGKDNLIPVHLCKIKN